MDIVYSILLYLFKVLTATLLQMFILLGPLLLLAFLMHFVAGWNERLSYRLLGRRGFLYVFGWLGTAVHELGHAIFAILFGHKINKIVFFDPDPNATSLGYVNHSYNPESIYQNIGNFFIGIGPIIFGSFILYLTTYLLFDISITGLSKLEFSSDSLISLEAFRHAGISVWESTITYVNEVLYGPNSSWWKMIILVYVLYSVGSSITLSGPDIRGATQGFLFFLIILFFFNIATLWIGDFTMDAFRWLSGFFSSLYFLIILSMVINVAFIVILLIINGIKMIFNKFSR